MNELKPCPWCGEDAVIVEDDYGGYGVVCGQWPDVGCPVDPATDGYSTAGKAVVAWNTRPLEDALHQRIAALEAENAALRRELAEAQQWQPVESGEYVCECGATTCDARLLVDCQPTGTLIQCTSGGVGTEVWIYSDDLRLFRRQSPPHADQPAQEMEP